MDHPSFFLLGAAKSGTTALARYLDQHPGVHISNPKEPNFFTQPDADEAAYAQLFAAAAPDAVTGEASGYLHQGEDVMRRILDARPDARFVAVLRNPVDRAYSHWQFSRQLGAEEHSDFLSMVRSPQTERQREYLHIGRYAEHLDLWRGDTTEGQLLVLVTDDLRADAQAVCRDVFRHIGVGESFSPDTSVRHNASRLPRVQGVHRFLNAPPEFVRSASRLLVPSPRLRASIKRSARGMNSRATSIDAAARRFLTNFYEKDIQAVERHLGRDLAHWRR